MPRPEILAAPWLVFLDCHVWIAVADNLDLIAFLCQDLELLVSPRRSHLFIVTRESLTPVDERSTFGSLDALDISLMILYMLCLIICSSIQITIYSLAP